MPGVSIAGPLPTGMDSPPTAPAAVVERNPDHSRAEQTAAEGTKARVNYFSPNAHDERVESPKCRG